MQRWIGTAPAYGATPVYGEPNLVCTAYVNINKPDAGRNALIAAADKLFRRSACAVLLNLSNFEDNTLPPNPQSWSIAWMSSDSVR